MNSRLRRLRPVRQILAFLALFAALASTAACGSAGGSNICQHKCASLNHAYYIDDADKRVAATQDPDDTTRAILEAGYKPTAHITGNQHGDWWNLEFRSCGKPSEAEACSQRPHTIDDPAITRETKPSSLANIGGVDHDEYRSPGLIVDMGSVICSAATGVTSAQLKALAGQVKDLRVGNEQAYGVPSEAPVFQCVIGS